MAIEKMISNTYLYNFGILLKIDKENALRYRQTNADSESGNETFVGCKSTAGYSFIHFRNTCTA